MAVAPLARVARRTQTVFFGWWIVLGGVWIQTLIAALLQQAYGSYVVVLREQFGWSKTALSAAYSIQQAESGLLGPLNGWLLDRYGARAMMRIGILMLGVGFMLFSRVNSLPMFYATFLMMAIGSSLGGFMSIMATIVNWFERRRATAMGLMQTGGALGGILAPAVAWSLTEFGWRATAMGSGVLIIALGLPATQLMRRAPEEYGLRPDGAVAGLVDPGVVTGVMPRGFTAREALRVPVFWYLSIAHGLAMFVVASLQVHLMVHLTEGLGYTLAAAALVVSAQTGANMCGVLVGGVLGDRYSKRVITTVATCGHVVAMIVLALAMSTPLIFAGAVIQGFAHGSRGSLMMPIRADYFGRAAFATIMGFSSMVMMGFMICGPLLVGIIADRSGEYTISFWMMACVAAVAAVLFGFAKKPEMPTTAPPVSPASPAAA